LGKTIKISVEPGRFIVADCSTLLCTITACKHTPERSFLGTDTGMNHLIRPALYGSHHEIVNLSNDKPATKKVTVCGNICECSDILGEDIEISGQIGDILGIENTGAYGFCMSSNYNERPKPAEVMLTTEGEDTLIRRR
jgi:diaminopimelate decarboxylase